MGVSAPSLHRESPDSLIHQNETKLSLQLLALIALGVIVFLLCERYNRIETTNGRALGTLTDTRAVGTGGRSKASFEPLSQSEVDGVEKFVSFIGYGRSGHSFIGAIMDAHPNVVIGHEYHVLQKCLPPNQKNYNLRQKFLMVFTKIVTVSL